MKFLRRIVVTDHFDDHGKRGLIQNGWSGTPESELRRRVSAFDPKSGAQLICSTKNQIRTLICNGLLYPLRNISIADI